MRARSRWLVPVVLVAGAAALVILWPDGSDPSSDTTATAESTTTETTLPSSTTEPITVPPDPTGVLERELGGLAAQLPVDSCLLVSGPGVRFAHREAEPVVPASSAKLLTASAAIDALGADTRLTGPGADGSTVGELTQRMLAASDDVVAARLAAELGGPAEIVSQLDDGGIDVTGVVLVDGTGHALEDRLTCNALVEVLDRRGTGPILQEGLAVAGRSGTLAGRYGDTSLEGVLRAKTGSLSSVTALAGVVDDGDSPLTFALVVNAPPEVISGPAVASLEQQIGEALVAWSDPPDGAVTTVTGND